MNTAYSKDKVSRSLKHFAIGKSLGVVLGAVLLLLLVRMLEVSSYGIYIAMFATLEIVQLISSCGLVAVAQRYLPEVRDKGSDRQLGLFLRNIISLRVITLAAGIAIAYFLSGWVTSQLGIAEPQLFQLFLWVIFFEGMARYFDLCLDSLLMQGVSQVSMLMRTGIKVLALTWGLVFWQQEYSLVTWIYIEIIASGCGALFACYYLVARIGRDQQAAGALTVDLSLPRLARYATPMYFAQSLYTFYGPDAIKVVASKLIGAINIGAFGFAAAFNAMLQRYLPVFLLIGMIRPLFVAARGRDDYQQRLPFMANIVFKLNLFVLLPIISFLVVGGSPLADLLTAGKFSGAGLYLVAFSSILAFQAGRMILSMVAQSMELGVATLAGTIFGLAGLVIGINIAAEHGPVGLCIGLALSELFGMSVIAVVLVRLGLQLFVDWQGLAKLLVATLLAIAANAAVINLLGSHVVVLLMSGAVGALVYAAFLFVFKPFTAKERELVNTLIKRRVFVW